MKTEPAAEPAEQIAETLGAVALRKHRGNLRRAWLLAGAGFAAGLLITVVTDWHAAWESPGARWAGPLAVWLLTAVFAFRALRIRFAGPDNLAAARALDRSVKNSMQRWSTFAALQPGGVGGTGSVPMTAALARELAPTCRFIDPATVDPVPPPKRTLALLAGAIVLLIGFLLFFHPQGSPRLLARFFLPWADLPLTSLHESAPPPALLLKGGDLRVAARINGKRPTAIQLEIVDVREGDAGSRQPNRRLTAAAPSTLGTGAAFTVERLRQPLRYRFRAGDGSTPWREVGVTERPRLSNITVTVTDPGYSEREPRVWHQAPSHARAIAGSELSVLIEVDRDVNGAGLEVAANNRSDAGANSPLQNRAMREIGDRRFQFGAELNSDFGFRPAFRSLEGFDNKALPFCHIEVVPDRPPAVDLTDASASEIVSFHHDLAVAFEAKDDVGISAAEVVFTIRDRDGQVREAAVPVPLGDQQGHPEVNLQTRLPLAELGLKEGDELAYAVRVRDSLQQASSSSRDEASHAEGNSEKSPESESDRMTKRPLKIGNSGTTSKSRQLRIAGREMLNRIEPKRKKLLAIEAAFQQLKAHTAAALDQTRAAKAPERIPGRRLETAGLFHAVAVARKEIADAEKAVGGIASEAPGTPYEFLSLQLETILKAHLSPADNKLEGAVQSRLKELPPREVQRRQAEGHLTLALAQLERLESRVAQIRSQVEAEFAMTKLMTMYVAQVEDLPVLLSGGGGGSPYQRAPGEVDKAQAEAALKRLESKKALYQKTAELLRQHPELWQRYMDRSRGESKIFRDDLENLARRHLNVRDLTAQTLGGDGAAEVRRMITAHQENVAAALLRSLEKARTWLPENRAPAGAEPAWLDPLNAAVLVALGNPGAESAAIGDLKESNASIAARLDSAAKQLERASIQGAPNTLARRFFALRLGEMRQTLSEQRLTRELIGALEKRAWRKAALLEQANITHQTQQLAGKIEVQGAQLGTLGDEVKGFGQALTEIMQGQLMPALAQSVSHLGNSAPSATAIPAASTAQADAVEGYANCLRALDNFVMAAIRELDREPASAGAGIAGLPKITAETLEELERKLQQENEIAESFGIPCCRPTNFQVMSDWERFAGGTGGTPGSPASSPSSGSSKKSQPSPGSPAEKGQSAASANSGGEKEKGSSPGKGQAPGAMRSRMDVASMTEGAQVGAAISELARAEALRQSQEIAARLSGKGGSKSGMRSGAGKGQPFPTASAAGGGGGRDGDGLPGPEMNEGAAEIWNSPNSALDWNRVGSELRREFLQEQSQNLPEAYRDAVEHYFRALSKWKARIDPAVE